MSGPPIDASDSVEQGGGRPIQDELVCLSQVAKILKLIEELGRVGDFEEDTSEIVDVLAAARRLIEEVVEALTAYFAAQGGVA